MYIIKLNHLIKLYIDFIYYLKQRYICIAYISFKSKIYDILHLGFLVGASGGGGGLSSWGGGFLRRHGGR